MVEICLRKKSGTNVFKHNLIIFSSGISRRSDSLTPFRTSVGACGKLYTECSTLKPADFTTKTRNDFAFSNRMAPHATRLAIQWLEFMIRSQRKFVAPTFTGFVSVWFLSVVLLEGQSSRIILSYFR